MLLKKQAIKSFGPPLDLNVLNPRQRQGQLHAPRGDPG